MSTLTDGPRVRRFIERNVVHAEGDYLGEPFILEDWQADIIDALYATNPDGSPRYTRALLGLARGAGKTELCGALALYELIGSGRRSPVVTVLASSWEQANLLFGAARIMATESPTLAPLVDAQEAKILLKDEPGVIQRVASVAGSNEGQRPTALFVDEPHELLPGTKERAHLVLSNGLRKRRHTREVNISTAGVLGQDSICERLYNLGIAGTDPRFLMRWHQAADDLDLSKYEDRLIAVRQANPASWVDVESIARRWDEIPSHEWIRYFANRFVAAAQAWLPVGSWDACAAPHGWPQPGTELVLGFDGSVSRDCTALVGCTLDGYVFQVRTWERPPHDPEWRVPRHEVNDTITACMARWRVVELAYDPPGWWGEAEVWVETWGEAVVVEFPTNVRMRMAEACSRFFNGVVQGDLTHDGDDRLARHLMNCNTKPTPFGTVITKQDKDSTSKIDAAVAAVVAYDRATRRREAVHGPPAIW